MSRRAASLALGLALLAGGLGWSLAAVPQLTLTNESLVFAQAAAASLGAFLAAGGALLLASVLRPRRWRAAAALLALGLLALGAERALFRVEVGPERLRVRGLLGVRSMDWPEVARVLTPAGELRLEDRQGALVRVATASLPAEQQASLERAVARHVATAHLPEVPLR